ncbi:MAG: CDP-alcohol phosphatidyltransferase family protein [Chloroflexota bacterium]
MAISNDTRTRARKVGEPIALFFGRLGLTPDGLTIIGFGITAIGALLLGLGLWLAGGIVVFVGAVFDMFDGALARATGRESRLGAFLDSVFDRCGEALVYVGIVWGTLDLGLWRPVVLAAAAMAAAFMVSYTRAKAEGLGFSAGTGMAAVGLAPREVRVVILTLGLVVAGILPGFPADMDTPGAMAYPLSALALEAALGLIAVLGTITVIQRILHTRAQARAGAATEAGDRAS